VDLWLGCADRRQQEYLLAHPREALSQGNGPGGAVRDPRLSEAGNHVWERVGLLLDVLGRMEVWMAHHGRTGLTPEDRVVLSPRFQKLSRDANSVAALSLDLVSEMKTAGTKSPVMRSFVCAVTALPRAVSPAYSGSIARACPAC
jgi:hypothetical protein